MMKFPILGFGQTHQTPSANRESLTTEEAVALANERINFLESELAKGGMNQQVRQGLMSELRSYKTFKATMIKAMAEGQIRPNEKMFNNRGRPTAEPGSFVGEAMKAFRMSEGMTEGRGEGRRGGRPAARTYSPQYHKYYKKRGVETITGNAGDNYPGMPGYVFDTDRTTPVRMTPGNAWPGKFPARDGNYFVFPEEGATPTQVVAGSKVPGSGTPGRYYASPAINDAGEAKTYIPASVGVQVQPVQGKTGFVHRGDSQLPFEAVVGGNVPWIGAGNTYVFPTGVGTGTSKQATVQKVAGVLVPGQTAKVFGENVQGSYVDVRAGAFVPGSGVHSRGGIVRNKVYTGTNPAGQHTWTAGLDTPWDGNAATRFNIDGGSATVAAGDAYPGQTNKVFDTDFSQYTKAAGKEVPGSTGYDRTDSETADADGVGTGAQVYNTSLNPINKTRGNIVPGDATRIYTASGANAAVTQPVIGSPVLEAGGGNHASRIYYRGEGAPVVIQDTRGTGIRSPTHVNKMYDSSGVLRNISTVTSDQGDSRSTYKMRVNPAQDAWYSRDAPTSTHTQLIFDPSKYARFQDNLGSKVAAGEAPPVMLMLPDRMRFSDLRAGNRIPLREIRVAPLHPDWRRGPAADDPRAITDIAEFRSWAEAAESGVLPGDPRFWVPGAAHPQDNPGGLAEDASLSIVGTETISSGATESQGQFVAVQLGRTGSRMSLMDRQGGGLGASTSTTTSSRASGAYRVDNRSEFRWI